MWSFDLFTRLPSTIVSREILSWLTPNELAATAKTNRWLAEHVRAAMIGKIGQRNYNILSGGAGKCSTIDLRDFWHGITDVKYVIPAMVGLIIAYNNSPTEPQHCDIPEIARHWIEVGLVDCARFFPAELRFLGLHDAETYPVCDDLPEQPHQPTLLWTALSALRHNRIKQRIVWSQEVEWFKCILAAMSQPYLNHLIEYASITKTGAYTPTLIIHQENEIRPQFDPDLVLRSLRGLKYMYADSCGCGANGVAVGNGPKDNSADNKTLMCKWRISPFIRDLNYLLVTFKRHYPAELQIQLPPSKMRLLTIPADTVNAFRLRRPAVEWIDDYIYGKIGNDDSNVADLYKSSDNDDRYIPSDGEGWSDDEMGEYSGSSDYSGSDYSETDLANDGGNYSETDLANGMSDLEI